MKKLKDLRLQHQLTCQQVADQVGISKEYYWMLENGERRLSYELAVKISKVFGHTPDQIFLEDQVN